MAIYKEYSDARHRCKATLHTILFPVMSIFFKKSTKLIGVDLGSVGFHHGNNISQHGVDLWIIKE